jgi:hypothetical protein
VISADEYRDLVVNNTQFSAGANIAFDEGCMMGVPLPEQGVMSPAAYQMHLAEFLEECWNKLRNPLSELLCQKLRTECASGFIVLDFLPHQPLSITRTDSAGGETSVVRENFVCSGLSTSQPGGFIALQSAPEERKAHEMLAHEMLYALAHELHKPDE